MVGGDIMMIIMIIIGVNNDVDDVTVWIVVEDESQWPKLKCTTILTVIYVPLRRQLPENNHQCKIIRRNHKLILYYCSNALH